MSNPELLAAYESCKGLGRLEGGRWKGLKELKDREESWDSLLFISPDCRIFRSSYTAFEQQDDVGQLG